MLAPPATALQSDIDGIPSQVQISMGNIETVVRERNRAYYQLETGTDGERPGKVVHNILGLTKFYR